MQNYKSNTDREENKTSHPYETCNIFSKVFFTWMFPLFVKGFRKTLSEEDLYPHLKSHASTYLSDKLEKEWKKELKRRPQNPSLGRCIICVFGKQLFFLGTFYIFIELIAKLGEPQFLAKFLEYFEPNSDMSKTEAYLYAAAIASCTLLSTACLQTYYLHMSHFGIKIRVATSALVYRKALRLSKSAMAETSVGQMVNLISNDVSRFETTTAILNSLWMAPLETIMVLIIIYFYVGLAGLIGVTVLLAFIPFQMWLGKKTSDFHLASVKRTDERIRLINEIILGIQVIKMYTWEKPFAKLVEIARSEEMAEILKISYVRGLTISFSTFLNRFALYLCILVYVLTGNILNVQFVFVLQSLYNILRTQVTLFFPIAITQIAEARNSVNRIEHFLLYDEVGVDTSATFYNAFQTKIDADKFIINDIEKIDKHIGIRIKGAAFKWLKYSNENTLENIDMQVDPGRLVALIGPVGSGKTTLLHAILGELSPVEGNITVNGRISYASQEPWLFVGSVRQNILFGQQFDDKKYNDVVNVCQLQRDFALFAHGDQTIVGERGASLSGGQRARINLARAVYKDADIYLLDDPLSAVDAHVGKRIFEDCITKYLREKCVVLVTHQLQYLKNVENIYILKRGRIESSGNYEETHRFGAEFSKLLSNFHEGPEEEINEEVAPTPSMEMMERDDDEKFHLEKETMVEGKILWNIYKYYLVSGGHWWKATALFIAFILCQLLASACDYFVTIWVNMNQKKNADGPLVNFNNVTESQDYWPNNASNASLLIFYSVIIFGGFAFTIARSLTFYKFCFDASVQLHNNLLYKIVFATMRFFNTNSSGRILNRFSKDMNQVDDILPWTLFDTIDIGLVGIAITIMVASVTPWMLLPTGVILTIFYLLKVVFVATSRDIKRLQGITRSPVFSHLTASLQGVTTIRAFGAQQILQEEFDDFQDVYSSSAFMFLAANHTFGFWLDVHCVTYIILVTFSFLFFESDSMGGNVGLAITQSMALADMFQWGMRQWSELENTMTCVERIKEYTDVVPESDDNVKEPPRDWPQEGNIVFDRLSLKYSPDEPRVLKELSFSIKSGEKVGIVGRTGAGKSSIIMALFRLAINEGKILIDDVDIGNISLTKLRSSLSIIPQEPVLFSGSLRKNLDLFDEFSDEVLWQALQEVELKQAVSELPHGLASNMSEGGSNFSVGQRQLVCLARAILRNNKILVLDEATANVDPHTDSLIQNTIRIKFANCTVLTIAHRLHTIMDSDKVMVMDAGKVVEFEHPHELLQNKEDGVFYELVQQTGKTMADKLVTIAAENYNKANRSSHISRDN